MFIRCGNVASILELDDYLGKEYKVFQHAPSVSDSTRVLFRTMVTSKSLGRSLNTRKTTPCGLLLVKLENEYYYIRTILYYDYHCLHNRFIENIYRQWNV